MATFFFTLLGKEGVGYGVETGVHSLDKMRKETETKDKN